MAAGKVNESILSETVLEDMKENRIDHMKYMEGMEVLDSDIAETVIRTMEAKVTVHRRISLPFFLRRRFPF